MEKALSFISLSIPLDDFSIEATRLIKNHIGMVITLTYWVLECA